jgi:hypothetical protein
MIFTKWIWIIPIVIFFVTMFIGIVFYDPQVDNTRVTVKECYQGLPLASTKVC